MCCVGKLSTMNQIFSVSFLLALASPAFSQESLAPLAQTTDLWHVIKSRVKSQLILANEVRFNQEKF